MKKPLIFKKNNFAKLSLKLIIGLSMVLLSATSVYAHESEFSDTTIIHITKKGFDPKKMNVQVGTKVVFENTDTEDRWPASDDHPSHTLYDGSTLSEHCASDSSPTFDSCKEIKEGDSWTFVFDKAGTYKYHDHLWPQFKGEIEVGVPNNNKSQNIFGKALDFIKKITSNALNFLGLGNKFSELERGSMAQEDYKNLKQHYVQIVEKYDPRESIGELKEKSAGNKKLTSICHDLTHAIGRAAFNKYGSFKTAAQYQEYYCNSGYLHGVFEAYFDSLETPPSDIKDICNDYGGERNYLDLWQCQHGSGHASMYITGGDLDRSLDLCSGYSDNVGAVSACQSGVFMEVFNSEKLSEESRFIDADRPSGICEKTSLDRGKGHCYFSLPTYYIQNLNMDFDQLFGECEKAENAEHVDICMEGIGAEAAKRNVENIGDVLEFCTKAPTYTNQTACIGGVVRMQMHQTGSFYSGLKLCDIVPSMYQNACFKAANLERPTFEDESKIGE